MKHYYERTTQFKSIEYGLDKVGLIMMVQSRPTHATAQNRCYINRPARNEQRRF